MGGRALLVLYKDGKVVYSHSAGRLNATQQAMGRMIARRQGMEPNLGELTMNTQMAIASCSKWLSAALVMTFVDEGRLKLTDTIGKYLPVLSPAGKGNITISDCLSHLTGIKAPPLRQEQQTMGKATTMEESVQIISELPMEGQPGKVFHYSSIGLQLAAAVLEKISGKDFRTLFRERIANPLHMNSTNFGDQPVPQPAGSARSTPADYIQFLSMILNKGQFEGKQILSKEALAAMQANRISQEVTIAYSPAEAGQFGYGYGEWVMKDHTVTSPGLFGSFPWVNNDAQYAGFLMTFYLDSDGRHARMVELKHLCDQVFQGQSALTK
nr:serine hydrolase domain-containing protein [Chitinophaga sp. Cy-1792]